MKDIKIGTMVQADVAEFLIPQLIPHGFESFALFFWHNTDNFNLEEFGKKINDIVKKHGCVISCLSVFGDKTFHETSDGESTRNTWNKLIESAKYFETDMVSGFTGRIKDTPVEESIPKFKEVFTPIAKTAQQNNVRISFENCATGGTWNTGDCTFGFNPQAWELMFEAVDFDNVGLQWEPCHQLLQLIDPIPQLRKWLPKIFNVHGKDATIAWDIIKEHGILGGKEFSWHRTPGFGDSNWTDIISILRMGGYKGTIDIEGFHDPVYSGDLEFTGQVRSLNYLKECRGGEYIDIHI